MSAAIAGASPFDGTWNERTSVVGRKKRDFLAPGESLSFVVPDIPGTMLGPEARPGEYVLHGPNGIRFKDGLWFVSFRGQSAHFVPTKGLKYIHCLLQRPGQDVPVSELVAASLGVTPGELLAAAGDAGPASDILTRDELRKRLGRIRERREEATDEELAQLDEEFDQVAKRLRADFGRRGRPRIAKSVADRQRKAVSNGINRAIQELGRKHQPFADHLKGSLKKGYCFKYAPREDLDWVFEW
jgi:hypothetical protein